MTKTDREHVAGEIARAHNDYRLPFSEYLEMADAAIAAMPAPRQAAGDLVSRGAAIAVALTAKMAVVCPYGNDKPGDPTWDHTENDICPVCRKNATDSGGHCTLFVNGAIAEGIRALPAASWWRAPGDASPLVFTYRNHRGEDAERHVLPITVRYGTTKWHPKPVWLMRAFDLDKNAEREFAMADIWTTPVDVLPDGTPPSAEEGAER